MAYTRRDLWTELAQPARPRQLQRKANDPNNILIVVFMRGAVDGLNVVVPHASDDYYALRPTVRVSRPGEQDGALDLDGFFGLHPALGPLLPAWQGGAMAAVQATGSPHESRSHFDAQAIMETGVQDPNGTLTGWLGRQVAATRESNRSPFRSVAIAGAAPRSLAGPVPPLALTSFNSFNAILNQGADFLDTIAAIHGQAAALDAQSRLAIDVLHSLQAANPAALEPQNGADYGGSAFGRNMQKAAQLIRAELGAEYLSVDIGGWDTHVNQNGALRNRLNELATGIAALMTDLGPEQMQRVTIVTMSEFGRRARENGSLGTDHGHGNMMLLLGAGVRGGQVYTQWPGLSEADLDRGDLQVTTDYRQVLSELLSARKSAAQLDQVFPGFRPSRSLQLFAS